MRKSLYITGMSLLLALIPGCTTQSLAPGQSGVTIAVTGQASNVMISYRVNQEVPRTPAHATLPWQESIVLKKGDLLEVGVIADDKSSYTVEIKADGQAVAESRSQSGFAFAGGKPTSAAACMYKVP